jgi:hypothetical protein
MRSLISVVKTLAKVYSGDIYDYLFSSDRILGISNINNNSDLGSCQRSGGNKHCQVESANTSIYEKPGTPVISKSITKQLDVINEGKEDASQKTLKRSQTSKCDESPNQDNNKMVEEDLDSPDVENQSKIGPFGTANSREFNLTKNLDEIGVIDRGLRANSSESTLQKLYNVDEKNKTLLDWMQPIYDLLVSEKCCLRVKLLWVKVIIN